MTIKKYKQNVIQIVGWSFLFLYKKPCYLGLSETFVVHLDWRNKVVGVSISAGSHLPDSKKRSQSEKLSNSMNENLDPLNSAVGFKSKVLVQPMEMGPQPDTAAFIQRMEQEKLAKERGETKDNRSFFAK